MEALGHWADPTHSAKDAEWMGHTALFLLGAGLLFIPGPKGGTWGTRL